jgi:uncharacterized protein (DUF1499 family)
MYLLLRYARNLGPTREEVLVGVSDGRLQPCPDTPNCVSSQAHPDDDHRVEPLVYQQGIDQARGVLLSIIRDAPRTRIVEERTEYIWAEFRTGLMGFVDDVELYFPADDDVVHYRSASRAGQGDLGVNRRRYEWIARAFEERTGQ